MARILTSTITKGAPFKELSRFPLTPNFGRFRNRPDSSPDGLDRSRMLIPSTITATARRTRKYTSTLYIHRTIHGVGYNLINDGRRYTIRSPILSNLPPTRPTLSPPFTLLRTYFSCFLSRGRTLPFTVSDLSEGLRFVAGGKTALKKKKNPASRRASSLCQRKRTGCCLSLWSSWSC